MMLVLYRVAELAGTATQGLSLPALRQLLDPPPAGQAQDADLERELWAALPAGCRGAWEGRPPLGGEVRPLCSARVMHLPVCCPCHSPFLGTDLD